MFEIRSIRIPERSLFLAKIYHRALSLSSNSRAHADAVKNSFSRIHWNAFSIQKREEEEEELKMGWKNLNFRKEKNLFKNKIYFEMFHFPLHSIFKNLLKINEFYEIISKNKKLFHSDSR